MCCSQSNRRDQGHFICILDIILQYLAVVLKRLREYVKGIKKGNSGNSAYKIKLITKKKLSVFETK